MLGNISLEIFIGVGWEVLCGVRFVFFVYWIGAGGRVGALGDNFNFYKKFNSIFIIYRVM